MGFLWFFMGFMSFLWFFHDFEISNQIGNVDYNDSAK